MKFAKYHGLGNDYIVLEASDVGDELTAAQVRLICHRNYGVGSDGILLDETDDPGSGFVLRIFNPDGSEAEKSGNGLRIYSRYLWDKGLVREKPFKILTAGGRVTSRVHKGGGTVMVEMGKVSFESGQIPVEGPLREVINERLSAGGRDFRFCAATVGNPHCVIPCDEISAEDARKYGPDIENNARFPNRTNVQFMKVIDRGNIRIEIWERGAGYTLASGSSSCASAAVAHRLGLCDDRITVHMPGGEIEIRISEDYLISMTGPVTKVCEGTISDEIFGRTI